MTNLLQHKLSTACEQTYNKLFAVFSNVIFIFLGIALKPDFIKIEMFAEDNPNLITVKVHWRFRVVVVWNIK